jgi:LPXTG-motif cell wall-anchored protein
MGEKSTLYFVGQIRCPEDDNCEYNQNSLYLISDEDKVIEVEDKDSTGILIVIGSLVILLAGTIYIRKRKRLK